VGGNEVFIKRPTEVFAYDHVQEGFLLITQQQSFAATAARPLDTFAGMTGNDPEFMKFGRAIFDSDELIDKIYEVYLSMIARGWYSPAGQKIDVADFGSGYVRGFYLPCTDRVVFSGQVDTKNDTIPDYAGIVLFSESSGPVFCISQKKQLLPRGVSSLPFTTPCALTLIFREKEKERSVKKMDGAEVCVTNFYFSVSTGGLIVPARRPFFEEEAGISAALCQVAAATINAEEDKRHIWLVKTNEDTGVAKTPLELGVDAEQVKSLFYARSLPITSSGRKRPILHWVRAHKRRLQDGIDIDISKHLRGIEHFEMGGFNFDICQPTKKAAKYAKAH
jgi:hypothetical protein